MRTQGKPEISPPAPDPIDAVFDDAGGAEGDGAPRSALSLATVRAPMQQVKTHYATAIAVQKPRDMRAVTKRIEQEAELCGEDFYYSWTVKNRDGSRGLVEGPSIDASMIMVRNFGNAAAESHVAEEGPAHWLLTAAFIDLETGFTLERQFRQRKAEAHQKKGEDADRLLDIAFQIGQSKAQRNVVVKAMPQWLVKRAMERAKESAEKNYAENLPRYIENCKATFATIGVTVAELEAKLGEDVGQAKPIAAWTVSDLGVLRAIHRAIIAHETNVQREFRPEPAPSPTATKTDPAPPPAPGSKP